MKKFVVVLLALCLMLALAACGKEAPAAEEVKIEAAPKVEEVVAPVETVAATGVNAPADVATSFTVMGYGMLGIFIVMIIIMLVILLLNVLTKPRKK